MGDLAVTEMLQEVKRSSEPWRAKQEFFYARLQMKQEDVAELRDSSCPNYRPIDYETE